MFGRDRTTIIDGHVCREIVRGLVAHSLDLVRIVGLVVGLVRAPVRRDGECQVNPFS